MPFDRITVSPEQMGGRAAIRGMRVTVSAVLAQLATGQSVEDVLADFPYLQREDILQVLSYAAAVLSGPGSPPGADIPASPAGDL